MLFIYEKNVLIVFANLLMRIRKLFLSASLALAESGKGVSAASILLFISNFNPAFLEQALVAGSQACLEGQPMAGIAAPPGQDTPVTQAVAARAVHVSVQTFATLQV